MSYHSRPSPKSPQIISSKISSALLALLLGAGTLPAAGQMATASNGKFVGNVLSTSDTVFDTYWNQATPENAGKWGSVEATRDVMNWTQLDYMYAYTRARGIPFKQHTFVWGQQYPTWIDALPANEQLEEVEEWIAAFAARYPDTEFIDVVNEPLTGHAPATYRNALGGAGTTGWDWVIWSFEKARQYFPNAKLLLNDYNIINNDGATTTYLTIINLLKDRGLIDGIGEQAHNFESTSITTLQNNLNRLAATGLPIYISELDIDLADDTAHSNRYQALFPIFWTNPAVRGITFWGYKQGAIWRTNGYLLRSDGSERPAMTWLKTYIAANPQSFSAFVTSPTNGQGLSNVSPVSASATVTYGTAPFTVTFQKKLDSETEFTTVSSDNTAPYTADLGNLPAGTYQIRVSVTDADAETVISPVNTFNVYPAAGGTWLGTSGNWNDSAIWADGTIANGVDATASFTGVDIAADQTITLNGNRTIGNIVFTDATTPSHNLTISGTDTLTLDVNSGAPVINVTQTDRRLTVSSVVAGIDGLQKAGSGMLTLSGNNTYTGTTTISAGTLRLEGNAFSTTARNYSISSGAVLHNANNQIPTGTTTISGSGILRGSFTNGIGSGRTLNLSLGAGGLIDIPSGASIYNGGWQAINWTNNNATLNIDGSLSIVDGLAVTAAALTGTGSITSSTDGGTAANFTLGVGNGTGTFSGNITAAGTRVISLVKNGTGTQTFSGSTTFRGTTTLNGGALQYAKASSLYAGVTTDWVKTKITVNNGCTIAFNVGGTDEFTAADVTTLLTGLGGAVNNNGLRAGSAIAFDTTNASGGTFTVADAIANTTGTGGGAVGLRKFGTNTLVLTNNNTYTGPTIVDDGTLTVTGSLGATAVSVNGGILAGNGNFGGNVTIAVGATHSLAVAATTAVQDTSAITGTLAMAQSTLNLTAASTPADGVYVLATATVGITGFPSFINYNGIAGTVSVDIASTPKRLLLTVNGSPPSFSASVTAPANGQVVSNLSPVTASATVTNGTAPFTVTFQKKLDSESEFTTVSSDDTAPYTADLGILPAGTYQIRVVVTDSDSATVNSEPNTFTVTAGPTSLSWDGGTTDIVATGDGVSGGGDGTWDTTIQNWDTGNGLAHAAWNNATNDTAIFGGAAGSISLGTGVTVGGMTFDSAYTVNSNTITFGTAGTITNSASVTIASALAGTVPITKTGAGTLTLSGNNDYTGTTIISSGILAISSNTALGTTSGNTTIAATGSDNGPRLRLSGGINSAENFSLSGTTEATNYANVISSASGTNTLSGNITLASPGTNGIRLGANGGNLILAGAINQTGTARTLTLSATGGGITVNNAIANGTAALNIVSQGGGGSVTLKGAQGAGGIGAVAIGEGGMLKLGVNDALRTNQNLTIGFAYNFAGSDTGTFDLAGFNQTVNGLVGTKNTSNIGADSSRIVTNSAASGTNTLTVNSGTFNGVINDGATAAVALTKTSTGTLTLVGNSNYSGVTTISGGIIAISHSNALGSTAGNTTIAATGASNGPQLTLSGGINSAENITITGATENSGFTAAITNTSGNNTLSGNIIRSSTTGGVRLGSSSGSLTFSGTLSQTTSTNQLTFITSGTGSIIVNNAISNNGGSLVIYGSGAGVTVKGVSGSGIGNTVVSQSGTLKLGVTDALNTGANLDIGVGNVTTTDAGTFDLAGFNQTVNALSGIGTAATNSNRKVTNSAAGTGTNTLTVGNGNGSGTFNGVIQDGTTAKVALIKTGSGTQTLAGVNTYSGNTTVSQGTLTLNNANANNQTSTVTIAASGATLNLAHEGTDTVDKLFIGATQLAAGEYGNSSSVLPIIARSEITGTGTLTVTTGPSGGNTDPTISDIANQSVPSGGNTGALPFLVGDAETPVGSLTPSVSANTNTTLVPNSNIVFGGSGANRTVTVTPVSGLSSSATITIRVTDGGSLYDEDTFTLTVTDNYLSWATTNNVTGGANGDDDNDGVKNLVEYALVDGGERGVLSGNTITFTKRGGVYGSDITYTIETSETLSDPWASAVTHSPELLGTHPTISHTFTPGSPVKKFARLKITGP